MTAKPDRMKRTPQAQLQASLDKLDPKTQKLFRSVRAAVRKRLPTANKLAFDYGQALVIGYAPADRGIDALVEGKTCQEPMGRVGLMVPNQRFEISHRGTKARRNSR
jgi:hypothetical protein